MMNFRTKQLTALAAIAGLGIGVGATPALAAAATHPATANVAKSDPASPDKIGTRDGASRDIKIDTTSSVDKITSIDRKTSVDPKADH